MEKVTGSVQAQILPGNGVSLTDQQLIQRLRETLPGLQIYSVIIIIMNFHLCIVRSSILPVFPNLISQ
ncbi:hypothetical protein ES708_28827 [subsurface metagenome]